MTKSENANGNEVAAVADLIHQYDTIWFDVQGVLMRGDQPDVNATALLRHLRSAGKGFCVITNQFSSSPQTIRQSLVDAGVEVNDCPLFTPRHVLPGWVRDRTNHSETCAVLGSPEDRDFATIAGLKTVDLEEPADILLVGHPTFSLNTCLLESALSTLLCSIAAGREPTLLIPNPDRVFPKATRIRARSPRQTAPSQLQQFGLGPGTAAHLLISLAAKLMGPAALNIQILGKPEAPLFERAKSLAPNGRILMVGDQLDTDIEGANRAGVDSLLLLGDGFPGNRIDQCAGTARPTYIARQLM